MREIIASCKGVKIGSIKGEYPEDGRSKFLVDIHLDRVKPDAVMKQTVDHEFVDEYFTLSVVGKVIYSGAIVEFGQYREAFRDIDYPYVNNEAIVYLDDIWKKYHLNDMKAACSHQTPFPTNIDYDDWRRLQQIETDKCPKGYKYGSKWLLEVIPDEEVSKIRDFIEILNNEKRQRESKYQQRKGSQS